MSQVLLNKPKRTVLYSEIYFPRKTSVLRSSAVEVSCYYCKQGLKEGTSLAMKRIDGKSVFVCNAHTT